jgi:hypothetical protein
VINILNRQNTFNGTKTTKADKLLGDVVKTKNYSIFKKIKGNRPLWNYHLVKLTNSILKNNLLANNPIIVNDNYEVIDGQHRLEVAKNNNLEIYYTVVPGASIQDVQQLNANLKPWTIPDYLHSYVELGLQDYIILEDYARETGLSIPTATYPLAGRDYRRARAGSRSRFRAGEYKVQDLKFAEAFAALWKEIRQFTDARVERDPQLVLAILALMLKEVDFTRLIKNFEKSQWKIERQVNTRNYLRFLEDVYNYNQKTKRDRFF